MSCDNIHISVIIPIYRVEKYICRCLKSLQKQSFRHWEAILVDDCSPDNSVFLARKVIGTDSRFKIIQNSQNVGLGQTRDIGIAHASGKYIFMLDSDDYLSSNALQKLFDEAEDNDADITVCAVKHQYLFTSRIYPAFAKKIIGHGKDFLYSLFFNCVFPQILPNTEIFECNKLIKRNLWNKHNLQHLPGRLWGEDFYITPQLLFFADKVVCLPDVLYIYNRKNVFSITSQKNVDFCLTQIEVFRYTADFLIQKQCFTEYKNHFYAHIYRHLFFEVMRNLSYWDDNFNKVLLKQICERLIANNLLQKDKLLWKNIELFYQVLVKEATSKELRFLKIRKFKVRCIPLWIAKIKQLLWNK